MRYHRPLLILAVLVAALAAGFDSAAAAANCYFVSEDMGHVCDARPQPAKYGAPPPMADSVLIRKEYGRIADNVPVYSEPSATSPVIRDSGDGFLFYSVKNASYNEVESKLYYMIDWGEWVPEEHFKIAEETDFHGVVIRSQPERPFGWMIFTRPFSKEPGGPPQKIILPRYTFVEIYDAVELEDGFVWYNIGDDRWLKQTNLALIDASPRPEGVGPNDYWVEVDLFEQSFTAYEGDTLVYAGLVSSGMEEWPTNEGLFQVWERHEMTDMHGAEGEPDWYIVEDVPYTMYFDFDIGLHAAYWHDYFGYQTSHGCVNMPPRDAEWIYNWSAGAPNDLWVWVHTSDASNHLEIADQLRGVLTGP